MTASEPDLQDPYTAPHFATSALITIDVQRDFLSEAPYGVPGTTEILPALRRVVSAFRAAGRPVVHVVRLYEDGGGNADLVRRRLLESGVRIAASGRPCRRLARCAVP
ncbi:cysteine hydrolase family protein [Streptomyces mirabilis]